MRVRHATLAGWLLLATLALSVTIAEQPGNIRIDTQQWRDEPIKHLYIHGTLNGDTAFHVFLPERAQWQGRLLQFLQGGLGGSENAGVQMGYHAYALANGAIYVESNQGHIGSSFYEADDTPTELAYEASYAVVQYAKSRAVELYGREPDYTYVLGGSGGGIRASGLLERFPKVYDGAVPVVGAGTIAYACFIHSLFEAHRSLLQAKAAALDDVFRVGGSGNFSDVLKTPEEQQAMRLLLAAGYPPGSIWQLRPVVVSMTIMNFIKYKADPSYFDEFWQQANDTIYRQLKEGIRGTVRAVGDGGLRLTTDLERQSDELIGYTLVFTSGALKGEWRSILTNRGAELVLSPVGPDVGRAAPGDSFMLNNRDLLAFRALYRYLLDPEDTLLKDYFRHELGQRRAQEKLKFLVEPDRPLGKLRGKMIAVFGLDDPLMWPSVAIRYQRQVRQALGMQADDHFRLHLLEHGVHGAPQQNALHRQIPVQGAVYKALDDLMAWVEQGIAPVPGTTYTLGELNRIILPKSARERRGYQPVATLTANGKVGRVEVAAGAEVVLSMEAEDPDNELTQVEVDFEGDGRFDETKKLQGKKATAQFTRRYDKAGQYFPTVRVTDSTGSKGSRARGIQNLASIRIVVR